MGRRKSGKRKAETNFRDLGVSAVEKELSGLGVSDGGSVGISKSENRKAEKMGGLAV
jgi:hypothetical protein